jgi:hypothetical protein
VEAAGSSKMLVTIHRITRHHIPEGLRLKVRFLFKYLLLEMLVISIQCFLKCILVYNAVYPLEQNSR